MITYHFLTAEGRRFTAYSNIRYWHMLAEEEANRHLMWLFRNEFRCIVEG